MTAAQNDLTPVEPTGERPGRQRNWAFLVFGVILVGAFGFIIVRGLGDAALFFYNADEAVERREDLGERRFRLQGRVVPDTVTDDISDDGTLLTVFSVSHNEVEVEVAHRGDPPELFKPGIPVVLEGSWEGETFESSRMLVKHEEVYQEDNPDRVEEYDPAP
jgi:cytochrome c-type biogenesis protein CcmE